MKQSHSTTKCRLSATSSCLFLTIFCSFRPLADVADADQKTPPRAGRAHCTLMPPRSTPQRKQPNCCNDYYLLQLGPINRAVSQLARVQLFAKFLRVFFHPIASKPISTACLLVDFNLPPNIFIKRQ